MGAGTATKSIGRWMRQVQRESGVLLVEEPHLAPISFSAARSQCNRTSRRLISSERNIFYCVYLSEIRSLANIAYGNLGPVEL